MSKLRFRVVETAFKKRAVEVPIPAEPVSEYFGKYVFNRTKMFKYLPSKVYQKLTDAIDNGEALDRDIADTVAEGMKKSRRSRVPEVRFSKLWRMFSLSASE